jgi:hypothetical protein
MRTSFPSSARRHTPPGEDRHARLRRSRSPTSPQHTDWATRSALCVAQPEVSNEAPNRVLAPNLDAELAAAHVLPNLRLRRRQWMTKVARPLEDGRPDAVGFLGLRQGIPLWHQPSPYPLPGRERWLCPLPFGERARVRGAPPPPPSASAPPRSAPLPLAGRVSSGLAHGDSRLSSPAARTSPSRVNPASARMESLWGVVAPWPWAHLAVAILLALGSKWVARAFAVAPPA